MTNKKPNSTPAAITTEEPNPELPFESALEELEQLVEQMEEGTLSLDESLKAFERGVALTRHCSSALSEAELKVQALTEDNELVDFEAADPDER